MGMTSKYAKESYAGSKAAAEAYDLIGRPEWDSLDVPIVIEDRVALAQLVKALHNPLKSTSHPEATTQICELQ